MVSKVGVKLHPYQQQLSNRFICRHLGEILKWRRLSSSSTSPLRPDHHFDNDTKIVADNEITEKSTKLGSRKLFQQIPVHPAILEHIRSIGVGVVPRDTSGRNNKKRFSHNYVKENTSSSDEYDDTKFIRKSRPLQHERQQLKKEAPPKLQSNLSTFMPMTWMAPSPFGPRSMPVQVIANVGLDAVTLRKVTLEPTSVESSSESESKKYSDGIESTERAMSFSINMNKFPKNLSQIPEIAIIGRSNVGKSTLLNALMYGNRDSAYVIRSPHKPPCQVPDNMKMPKGIKAIMSDRPGETKQISFFKLQHKYEQEAVSANDDSQKVQGQPPQPQTYYQSLLLVDLPGYGFAYASETDKIAYSTLTMNYLLLRGKTLQRVLLLIDARHGMKKADFEFLSMLEEEHIELVQNSDQSTNRKDYTLPFPIQIVLTKCDLVDQIDLARRVAQVRQQLSDLLRREPGQLPVMLVSARPGVGFNNVDPNHHVARGGILELQKELAALAQPRKA